MECRRHLGCENVQVPESVHVHGSADVTTSGVSRIAMERLVQTGEKTQARVIPVALMSEMMTFRWKLASFSMQPATPLPLSACSSGSSAVRGPCQWKVERSGRSNPVLSL